MRSTGVPNNNRQKAFSLLQEAAAIEEATFAAKKQEVEDASITNFMREVEEEQKSIEKLLRDCQLAHVATITSTDSSEIPFDERSLSVSSQSIREDNDYPCSAVDESRDDDQVDARDARDECRDSEQAGFININTRQSVSFEPSVLSRIQTANDDEFGDRKATSPISIIPTSPTMESISENSENEPQPVSETPNNRTSSTSLVNQKQCTLADKEGDSMNQFCESAKSMIDEEKVHSPPTACKSKNDHSSNTLFERDGTKEGCAPSTTYTSCNHIDNVPPIVKHQQVAQVEGAPKTSKKFNEEGSTMTSREVETRQDIPLLSYSISTNDSAEESTPKMSSDTTVLKVAHQVQSMPPEQILKECYAAIISLKQTSESKYGALETKYLELKDKFTNLETRKFEKERNLVKSDSLAKEKCKAMEEKHTELTEIIAQLEVKNQKLLIDSTRSAEKHLELKETYLKLEYQNEKLKEELVNFDDKYDDLQDSYAAIEARKEQLDVEAQLSEKLDERCRSVEAKCVRLQESFEHLEAQNQSLKEENTALRVNNELLDSKCRDLVQSNIQLNSRNLKLEDVNESLKAMQTSLEESLKSAREEIKLIRALSEFTLSNRRTNCSENDNLNFVESSEQGHSFGTEQHKTLRNAGPPSESEESARQPIDSMAVSGKEAESQSTSGPLNPWRTPQSPRKPLSSPRPPLSPQLKYPNRRGNSSSSWNFGRDDDSLDIRDDQTISESDESIEEGSQASIEDYPDQIPSQKEGKRERSPSKILEAILRAPDDDEDLKSFFQKDFSFADSDETLSPKPLSQPRNQESSIGKPLTTLEMLTHMCNSNEPNEVADTLLPNPEQQALQFGAMLLFGPQAPLIPHLRHSRDGKNYHFPLQSIEDDRSEESTSSSEDELKLIMTRSSTVRKHKEIQNEGEEKSKNQDEGALVAKRKRDLCDCFMPLEFETPQSRIPDDGTSPPLDLSLTIKKSDCGCDPCDSGCGVEALQEAITVCSPSKSAARKIGKNSDKQQRTVIMNGEKPVLEVSTVHLIATKAVVAGKPKVATYFASAASSDTGSTIAAKVHNSKKTLRERAKLKRQQEHEANEQGLVVLDSSSGDTDNSSSSETEKVVLRTDKKIPLRPLSGGGRVFPFL